MKYQKIYSIPAFLMSLALSLTLVPQANAQNDSKKTEDTFIPYTEQIEGSDIGIEMVPIESGTFMMGSTPDSPFHEPDESPVHEVSISPFWMGKFEITWNQYEQYMNSGMMEDSEIPADIVSRPSKTYIDPSYGMGKEDNPAVNMTNYAALTFAKWLTMKTGNFYRLPTEAEWEYACRAGTSTLFHFGDNVEELDEYAWYWDNSDEKYHIVGSKKPNSFGLYDMHGNVSEWTLDQYSSEYYSKFDSKTAQDPWQKPTDLHPRTVRGGSWYDEAATLRCASRIESNPVRWKRDDPQIPKSLWWNTNSPFVGFRLVRPLEQPSEEEIQAFWEATLDQ